MEFLTPTRGVTDQGLSVLGNNPLQWQGLISRACFPTLWALTYRQGVVCVHEERIDDIAGLGQSDEDRCQ
jgi:hypothetical protein